MDITVIVISSVSIVISCVAMLGVLFHSHGIYYKDK